MNPLQVMIVDGHPGIRAMVRELLLECVEAHGRKVAISEHDSAESAIQELSATAPDIVTLDLRMNGADGLSCLRRLRQLAPRTMIIVVTSMQGESVARLASLAGCDAVVHKDDLTSMQTVISHHLRRNPPP